MTVPFFKTSETLLIENGSLAKEIDLLFEDCELTNGNTAFRLEKALQEYTMSPNVIAVGNATDALAIALKAIGITEGDEVIVPAYTFFASASSIVHAGAKPVFADIDPDTYLIDINGIERLITPNTKAIMPVHLFSRMVDMQSIIKIANKHNLLVIEDSAEAIGMYQNGVHGGLIGDIGVLSFFPTKTLGAFGDAGAIITKNSKYAQICRALRTHGYTIESGPVAESIGYNSKIDGIQCAVLLARLPELENEIRERLQIACRYNELLGQLEELIKLPPIPSDERVNRSVFYVYLIQAQERDQLRGYLAEKGIGTETYYPIPLHLQPCFKSLGYNPGDFPASENASRSALALPLYAGLSMKSVEEVVDTVKTFYERRMN